MALKEKISVAIVGASGYTGGELLRILIGHPFAKIEMATSEQSAGQPVVSLFPNLRGLTDLAFEPADLDQVEKRADFVFLALPHGRAMEPAARMTEKGKRIIDLSADFRLRDPERYREWYKQAHSQPQLLKTAVYGLTEWHRDEIKGARLVANPGCYPTGALLALLPLLEKNLVDPDSVVIDSKSGVSGAGRTPGPAYHFPEANEGLTAYGLGGHRHKPEIEQEMESVAGFRLAVSFTPHLLPVTRGIYTTAYARSAGGPARADEAAAALRLRYRDEPFIQVLKPGLAPNLNAVRGSNRCQIGLVADPLTGRLTIFSAIDNLVKGAAGQAVQNMNLMCGFDETTGLYAAAIFP